jgi:hypothetical protein
MSGSIAKTGNRYRVDSLSVESLNRILMRIQSDIDESLAIGQNPDIKGRNIANVGKAIKPHHAVNKSQFDAHTHKLSDLEEKDYDSLTNRPDDDDFAGATRKVKTDLNDEDWVPVKDSASKTYKKIPASLVKAPTPATSVVGETDFEKLAAVGVSPDEFARGDHTHGSPTITRLSGLLGADVAMTLANTPYDGPTVSLTEGRWFVAGTVTVASDTGAAHSVTAKLWDGTSTYASSETRTEIVAATKVCCSLGLSAIINVLAAAVPLAIKITCLGTGTAAAIKAAAINNGAGNNASHLNAIRIGPSV